MEKRENELRVVLVELNGQSKKKTVVREEKTYKYLPRPNSQISYGSAAMRHSRASGAALPHQVRQQGIERG